MNWRFLLAHEAESLPTIVLKGPLPAIDPRKNGNDVYKVASGTVRRGDEIHDVSGETIKVVGPHLAERDWVYESVDIVVHLPGGYKGNLRPGTLLAVLPENYQELLKNGRRRVGTGSPAGAGHPKPG